MAFNLLIVDDSPAMRRVVRRVVEISGFDVGNYFEAGNGNEALSVLRKDWIDLVLTDINMPGMDGQQLLTEIRRDSMLCALPVLVVSTDRSDVRLKQMLSLGADGYVAKPFQPATLSDEMTRVLEAHRMQAKDFQSFLPECCTEVFDSMYFVSVFGVIAPLGGDDLEPVEAASDVNNLAFALTYSGDIAGDFGVSLSADAARTLAANFLGSDEAELSSEETREVVGELANMLCGAVMSRVAGTHTFVLSHPQALDPLGVPKTGDVLSTLFETEIGPVCVWVTMEGAVCSR